MILSASAVNWWSEFSLLWWEISSYFSLDNIRGAFLEGGHLIESGRCLKTKTNGYRFLSVSLLMVWTVVTGCVPCIDKEIIFNYQKPKAAPNSSKMAQTPVACIQSILMAANPSQCCVTWSRTEAVGPCFRGAWTALLISILLGRPTRTDLETWMASFGLGTTIFIVWQPLITSLWGLTWKTLMGTSHTLSTRLSKLQMKEINTGSWLEDTMARLVIQWHTTTSKKII